MKKLVFFVGQAGTGKTTVAKAASSLFPTVFLDKDTVTGKYTEKLLEAHGRDKKDRDSSFYHQHLRDLEYEVLMDAALENLVLGRNVFLIAPFTKELANPTWVEDILATKGLSLQQVDVKVVIVYIENEQMEKERIINRKNPRDDWKLHHWEDYKQQNKTYDVAWNLSSSSILRFNNSTILNRQKIHEIDAFIRQFPARKKGGVQGHG